MVNEVDTQAAKVPPDRHNDCYITTIESNLLSNCHILLTNILFKTGKSSTQWRKLISTVLEEKAREIWTDLQTIILLGNKNQHDMYNNS